MGEEYDDITVEAYREILNLARAGLDAIEERCLGQRADTDKLTPDDWDSIRSTYLAVVGPDRGKPPMSRSC